MKKRRSRETRDREVSRDPDWRSAYDVTKRWVGAINSTKVASGADLRKALEKWKPDRRS